MFDKGKIGDAVAVFILKKYFHDKYGVNLEFKIDGNVLGLKCKIYLYEDRYSKMMDIKKDFCESIISFTDYKWETHYYLELMADAVFDIVFAGV